MIEKTEKTIVELMPCPVCKKIIRSTILSEKDIKNTLSQLDKSLHAMITSLDSLKNGIDYHDNIINECRDYLLKKMNYK